MKLTCPACGAVCSAESWQNDAQARQFLRTATRLPESVAKNVLNYLAMFRPSASRRGMKWSRAMRLVVELSDLVAAPFVSWESKPARPNLARAWGLAMERMIERPPKRLPLKSHGYLRSVAYEIADEMDKSVEKKHIKKEQDGSIRGSKSGADVQPERIDKGVLRNIREVNMKGRKGARREE